MAETQLYLIRHGQTDWNVRAMLQGRTDIPLNDTGRQQAMEARQRLAGVHFDAVYSSPLQRAMDTASLVTGWPKERISPDRRLIEIAFGPYEGKDPHALGPGFAAFFTARRRARRVWKARWSAPGIFSPLPRKITRDRPCW